MAAISQTTFSYALIYILISIKFYYSLFTMVQLTISNIPTSVQKIAWCRLDSVTHIYAALGGDVLKWYIPVDYIAYHQFRTLKIANCSIGYMILYMAVAINSYYLVQSHFRQIKMWNTTVPLLLYKCFPYGCVFEIVTAAPSISNYTFVEIIAWQTQQHGKDNKFYMSHSFGFVIQVFALIDLMSGDGNGTGFWQIYDVLEMEMFPSG